MIRYKYYDNNTLRTRLISNNNIYTQFPRVKYYVCTYVYIGDPELHGTINTISYKTRNLVYKFLILFQYIDGMFYKFI